MLNQIVLIGRWAAQPKIEYIKDQTAVMTATIALNRAYNKEKVDFVQVQAWKKLAENTTQYTEKGSLVCVHGELRVDSWEKEGQKYYKTYVLANKVVFLNK